MSKVCRSMTTSNFYCPECGIMMPLPRHKGYQREKGHIKDLWCPRCKKKTKFHELRYNEFYKNALGEVVGAY